MEHRRWEYRIVRIEDDSVKERQAAGEILNRLGDEGWELVSVTTPHASSWVSTAYMKRELSMVRP